MENLLKLILLSFKIISANAVIKTGEFTDLFDGFQKLNRCPDNQYKGILTDIPTQLIHTYDEFTTGKISGYPFLRYKFYNCSFKDYKFDNTPKPTVQILECIDCELNDKDYINHAEIFTSLDKDEENSQGAYHVVIRGNQFLFRRAAMTKINPAFFNSLDIKYTGEPNFKFGAAQIIDQINFIGSYIDFVKRAHKFNIVNLDLRYQNMVTYVAKDNEGIRRDMISLASFLYAIKVEFDSFNEGQKGKELADKLLQLSFSSPYKQEFRNTDFYIQYLKRLDILKLSCLIGATIRLFDQNNFINYQKCGAYDSNTEKLAESIANIVKQKLKDQFGFLNRLFATNKNSELKTDGERIVSLQRRAYYSSDMKWTGVSYSTGKLSMFEQPDKEFSDDLHDSERFFSDQEKYDYYTSTNDFDSDVKWTEVTAFMNSFYSVIEPKNQCTYKTLYSLFFIMLQSMRTVKAIDLPIIEEIELQYKIIKELVKKCSEVKKKKKYLIFI